MAAGKKFKFMGFRHSTSPDPVFLKYGKDEAGDDAIYGVGDTISLSASERDRLSNYVVLEDSSGNVVDSNPDAAVEPVAATSAVDATVSDSTTTDDADAGKASAKS
jgi:hypothetical protein